MNFSSSREPRLKWLALAALVLALALGVARALYKRQAQQSAAQTAAVSLNTPPAFVLSAADVVVVRTVELETTVAVSGALRALQTAVIKARAAGEIAGLSKREGDAVAAGEVLARIDSTEPQARLRQSTQQAQAALAQVTIAQRTVDNNQALVHQGFISATALETANANLNAAQANHRAAQAAQDIAHKGLGDTTVRSPLAGQVSARFVQNGERVGVDARVLEVVDVSSLELEAALPPADAAQVAVGQTAQLKVEGWASLVPANVLRINPNVQTGSRSVLVYLRLAPAAGLRPGLFAQGRLVTQRQRALALPMSAVRNDKPQPYVQVVQNGQVVHRTVRLVIQGQHEAEPWLALDNAALWPEGTQVLSAQAGAVREGTAVSVTSVAQ